MKKRLTALVTAFLMIIQMLPTSALAGGGTFDAGQLLRGTSPAEQYSVTIKIQPTYTPQDLYVVFEQDNVQQGQNKAYSFRKVTSSGEYSSDSTFRVIYGNGSTQSYQSGEITNIFLFSTDDIEYIFNNESYKLQHNDYRISNGGTIDGLSITINNDNSLITIGDPSPIKCTVNLNVDYDVTNKLTPSDSIRYYIIASNTSDLGAITHVGYAKILSDESGNNISFYGSNSSIKPEINSSTTFSIIKSNTTGTTLNAILSSQEGSSLTESGAMDDIQFSWDPRPTYNNIGSEGSYTFTVENEPNVIVSIDYTGKKLELLDQYYLVAGKPVSPDNIPYKTSVRLDSNTIVGEHKFYFDNLPSNGNMWVLLKKYEQGATGFDPTDQSDGHEVVWNDISGPILIENEKYNVSWDGPTNIDGKLYYKITIQDEPGKYPATFSKITDGTLPDGYYIVAYVNNQAEAYAVVPTNVTDGTFAFTDGEC